MQNVTTVAHPLVQHKLTLMRDKTTSTKAFRPWAHSNTRHSTPKAANAKA